MLESPCSSIQRLSRHFSTSAPLRLPLWQKVRFRRMPDLADQGSMGAKTGRTRPNKVSTGQPRHETWH